MMSRDGDGDGGRSQEKKKSDDDDQQTEDCLASERIIRFDELFPPADPMNTEKKLQQQTVSCLVLKRRIRFDRQFPSDIIFEILGRTTFEMVDACTRVSKEWRGLVTHKRFTDFYRKKHNISNLYDEKVWLDFSSDQRFICKNKNDKRFVGYFLHRRHHPTIFVPLDEKNYHPSVLNWRIPKGKEILASSKQGIVVCCDWRENYFVGKPASRKWMAMPKPDDFEDANRGIIHGIVVLGLSPLWYKVVKLDWGSHYLYYQIFDSKLWRWGKAEVFYCVVRAMICYLSPTVCISEFIYWQTYNNHLVVFDGLNDSFSIMDFPYTYCYENQIHEFNGRLGLIGPGYDNVEMELWEMVDVSNDTSTWRKRMLGVQCKDMKRRRDHNILYIKVQDEIITYRKCDFYWDRCCRIFPFGL